MDPVKFSPSCLSEAVAVMTPSAPLMLKSQSPAMLPCAESDAAANAIAAIADNTFDIAMPPEDSLTISRLRRIGFTQFFLASGVEIEPADRYSSSLNG